MTTFQFNFAFQITPCNGDEDTLPGTGPTGPTGPGPLEDPPPQEPHKTPGETGLTSEPGSEDSAQLSLLK